MKTSWGVLKKNKCPLCGSGLHSVRVRRNKKTTRRIKNTTRRNKKTTRRNKKTRGIKKTRSIKL